MNNSQIFISFDSNRCNVVTRESNAGKTRSIRKVIYLANNRTLGIISYRIEFRKIFHWSVSSEKKRLLLLSLSKKKFHDNRIKSAIPFDPHRIRLSSPSCNGIPTDGIIHESSITSLLTLYSPVWSYLTALLLDRFIFDPRSNERKQM